jgi:hypothetical protein
MTDLTYELQRMVSRASEIQAATKKNGIAAAWEAYSRDHGIDQRRFKGELSKLRTRFDAVGAGQTSR